MIMCIMYNTLNTRQLLKILVVAIGSFGLILGASGVGAATDYTFPEPDVSAYANGDNTIEPGETGDINLRVENSGESVINNGNDISDLESAAAVYDVKPGNAEAVKIRIRNDGGTFIDEIEHFDIKSGIINVGQISPGTSAGGDLTIEADESIDAGVYEIPVEIEYTYVSILENSINEHTIDRDTETVQDTIQVRVEQTGNLELTNSVTTGLYDGSEGTVTVGLRNSGNEVINDATLHMKDSQNIRSTTNDVDVGTLRPGEQSEATFQATASDVDGTGNYTVGFELQYEGSNGNTGLTDTEHTAVRIQDGPDQQVTAVESEMYVDSIGRVTVQITNTGQSQMKEARLNLQPQEPFSPVSSSGWVGTLNPGETTTSTFKLDVSDRAVAQSYPLDFVVEYYDGHDNRIVSEVLTAEADVGAEKTFAVQNGQQISVGSTDTVEYTITNTGDSEITDATVRLNSNTPFETDDDTTFAGSIDPDESKTVQFKLSVEDSATIDKTYSLDTTIKYKNEYGDTVTTDTVSAPITVTESEGLPVIPLIGGIAAITALVTALVLYRIR